MFKSKGHKANIAATSNTSGKVSKELPSQGLSSTTKPKAEKGGSKISSSDSGDPSEDAKFPPAGDYDALLCSCAPTAYSLTLNFNGKCNNYDTLASVDGIDGSICFFAQGADELDDVSVGTVDLPDGGGDGTRRRTLELANIKIRNMSSRPVLMGNDDATADNDESGHKRRQDSTSEKEQWWVRATFSDYDFSSQLDHAREIQARRQHLRRMQEQEDDLSLQDTTPATITSISFFEADTTASFNILNEEVTYFDMEGGELTDGDVLNYTSISSKLDSARPINDQMELVPGGVMLLLFGINDNNVVVQNTIAWGYTTNCDCEISILRDDIGAGWITIEELQPPRAEFCDGVATAGVSISASNETSKSGKIESDGSISAVDAKAHKHVGKAVKEIGKKGHTLFRCR